MFFQRLKYYNPSIGESFWLILLAIIPGTLLGAVSTIALNFSGIDTLGITNIISYIMIFVPPFLYIHMKLYSKDSTQANPVEIDNGSFGKIAPALHYLMLPLIVISTAIATEPLVSWMETPDFMKKMVEMLMQNKLSGFILVAILAPLLEELFCRGIILKGMLQHTSPAKAILISALMFGLLHMNPWQAIPAFIIGSIMGWIYYRTGSLKSTIIMHFINNSAVFILYLIFPDIDTDSTLTDIIPQGYFNITLAVAFLLGGSILLIMNRYYGKTISNQIHSNS